MKKIFTLFFCTIMACVAFAGFNDGKITITHLGIQDIQVEIDGKDQGTRDRLVMVNNLVPGYHVIKIYSQTRTNDQNRRRDDRNSIKTQLIYSGKIRLKPNYHVDIVINRFGKVLIDERQMNSQYSREYGNDNDYSYFENDRNHDESRRYDDRNDDGDRRNYNDRNESRSQVAPMQDQSFASLLETLKKESFESTRLKLAKQVTEQHYFISSQVKLLLQSFSFEESRLDLAKFMYGKTIDKENYFQLYDAFSFSASKEELASFVRGYK